MVTKTIKTSAKLRKKMKFVLCIFPFLLLNQPLSELSNLEDVNNFILFVLCFMLTFTLKSIKHSDLYNLLYTNSYTNGIQ